MKISLVRRDDAESPGSTRQNFELCMISNTCSVRILHAKVPAAGDIPKWSSTLQHRSAATAQDESCLPPESGFRQSFGLERLQLDKCAGKDCKSVKCTGKDCIRGRCAGSVEAIE